MLHYAGISIRDQVLHNPMNQPSHTELRIATRNSPLALWQANFVKHELRKRYSTLTVKLLPMTTKGDQLLDRSLSTAGGKGLFLKELEIALLNKEADIAVHSMKDVPAVLPGDLEIAALCKRADPRDAFVSNKFTSLDDLPVGARVGTSSLRRAAQLKHAFPSLQFAELRGNVNTRLAKLDNNDYCAIILAAAGLNRLGFSDRIAQLITPELCLPAAGQGIVGIECRAADTITKDLIAPLHNQQSDIRLSAERAMSARLNGGCSAPIGGYAEIIEDGLRMRGLVAEIDGRNCLTSELHSSTLSKANATSIGNQVAENLLQQGAQKILDKLPNEA